MKATRADLQGAHTTPIQTRKQGFKLRSVQPQNTVFDRGPFERVLLKPLGLVMPNLGWSCQMTR